ncbi:MAG TPA: biliverdin-producing heme oxygenase [Rhodopila sp.]|nr:biliverdin-producing heme oxygenase [Rhodopila sp.]
MLLEPLAGPSSSVRSSIPITAASSRVDRLRHETRADHDRIETVPALSRLVMPDLTREIYVGVLQHLEAFHSYVEPAMACALKGVPSARSLLDGNRLRWLAEDLAWFGGTLLPAPAVPIPDTKAGALGMLYVIEGSGLGGRVIGRHLSDSLGVRPGQGGSFYCTQPAETSRRRWRQLCHVLEEQFPDDGAERELIDGARLTFRFLDRWLRKVPTVPDVMAAVEP